MNRLTDIGTQTLVGKTDFGTQTMLRQTDRHWNTVAEETDRLGHRQWLKRLTDFGT